MSQPPILDVVCLCAEWCGTCRDYRATFDALKLRVEGKTYVMQDGDICHFLFNT